MLEHMHANTHTQNTYTHKTHTKKHTYIYMHTRGSYITIP
jgi:hypothetical protein